MEWTDTMKRTKEEQVAYKKEYDRLYHIRNKHKINLEEQRERSRIWRKTNINHTLANSARKRAKVKNVPFNITWKDIYVPEFCPILGVRLEVNQEGSRKYSKCSPSLDRIVPELGYIIGNIQVISHLANVMKNSATYQELLKFSDWVQGLKNE